VRYKTSRPIRLLDIWLQLARILQRTIIHSFILRIPVCVCYCDPSLARLPETLRNPCRGESSQVLACSTLSYYYYVTRFNSSYKIKLRQAILMCSDKAGQYYFYWKWRTPKICREELVIQSFTACKLLASFARYYEVNTQLQGSSYLSIRPSVHVSTRQPLDRFWWNLIWVLWHRRLPETHTF
jgi:hypothetical protein